MAHKRVDLSYMTLTPLESKIMALRLQGLSYREISEQTGLRFRSVENYGNRATQKQQLIDSLKDDGEKSKQISYKRARGRATIKEP